MKTRRKRFPTIPNVNVQFRASRDILRSCENDVFRRCHFKGLNVRLSAKGGSNSVVECQLPKLDVAGSTPVSRSNNLFHMWLLGALL